MLILKLGPNRPPSLFSYLFKQMKEMIIGARDCTLGTDGDRLAHIQLAHAFIELSYSNV